MPSSPAPDPRQRTRARIAVSIVFATLGVVFATWATRVPSVKDATGVTDGRLGLALLGVPVGMVLATRWSGRLTHRFGSGPTTRIATIAFVVSVLPIATTRSFPTLLATLVVFGAASGTLDTAMNAHSIVVSDAYERPVVSSFHAMYNVGAIAGAAFGATTLHAGWSTGAHFGLVAGVSLAVAIGTTGWLFAGRFDAASGEATRPRSAARHHRRRLALLSVILLCSFSCEGVAADWSAVYLRDHLGAAPSTAAIAFTLFASTMFVARVAGDRITHRFGTVRPVQASAIVGVAGMLLVVSTTSVAAVLAGWALFGVGQGVIAPIAFASASRIPGIPAPIAMARLAGTGYVGLMLGPPVIGGIAELVGLRTALGFPLALCVLFGLLANSAAPPTPATPGP